MRRFEKLHVANESAAQNSGTLKKDNARLRRELLATRTHMGTFLGNVWRTIHEEPKERWPAVFGKLYSDHFRGALRCQGSGCLVRHWL